MAWVVSPHQKGQVGLGVLQGQGVRGGGHENHVGEIEHLLLNRAEARAQIGHHPAIDGQEFGEQGLQSGRRGGDGRLAAAGEAQDINAARVRGGEGFEHGRGDLVRGGQGRVQVAHALEVQDLGRVQG